MKATLMTITPEVAKQLLLTNTKNRPVTENHVQELAREMKGGRWKVNGDMIRVTVDNRILDGQHRLHAVVRSGVTIQSWVMEGLPEDVFDTIDVGKKRSAGDTLGVIGNKNSYRLAAALAVIDQYMTGRMEKCVRYSNTEVEELLRKYPDAGDYLLMRAAKGLLIPSVMDACYYLFSKKDKTLANAFVEKVCNGKGMEEGDPFYVLRERLVTNSLSTSKLTKPLLMALCIKAWNNAREGKHITKLQINTVDGKMANFPVVI